jgi:mRNA-degrading endonuclease RelE of RelBE toxin-antitoxin system
MAFRIEFSHRARDNLKALRKRDQQIVADAIAVQLTHQPDEPTRQRKKLEEMNLLLGNCALAIFAVL